jgi:hypothetical protein
MQHCDLYKLPSKHSSGSSYGCRIGIVYMLEAPLYNGDMTQQTKYTYSFCKHIYAVCVQILAQQHVSLARQQPVS